MNQTLEDVAALLWKENDLKQIIPILKRGKDSYSNDFDDDLSASVFLECLSLSFHVASDNCKSDGFTELANLLSRIDLNLRKLAKVSRRGVSEISVDLNNLIQNAREELTRQEVMRAY